MNEKNNVKEQVGEIQIADEVVATIASYAAREVEGVDAMAGGNWNEIRSRFGAKSQTKGVKVAVSDDVVYVDLAFYVKYGYSIPKITAKVQERVVSAIESMIGLRVEEVNIRIAGVNLDSGAEKED